MLINASCYSETSTNSPLTLLWQNDDPSQAFAAQTINVDLSGYTELYVSHVVANSDLYLGVSVLINDPAISNQMIRSRTAMLTTNRTVTLTSDTIKFSTGTYVKLNTSTGNASGGTGTTYMIPYRIYGRK